MLRHRPLRRAPALRLLAGLLAAASALPAAAPARAADRAPVPPAVAVLPAGVTRPNAAPTEELHYRWRVRGLLSGVAALFLPTSGVGTLAQARLPNEHLVSELLVTSPGARAGEYWYYGAELDPVSQVTVRAWSSYLWRGETKAREAVIGRVGVIDIASGIQALRRDPPLRPRRLEIWSEGRVYPVVVIPLEREPRKIGAREVTARRYSIQGVDIAGRRRWKGRLELWLAEDGAATPVEITLDRGFASLQLLLAP